MAAHQLYTKSNVPNAAHAAFAVHAMSIPMVALFRINSGRLEAVWSPVLYAHVVDTSAVSLRAPIWTHRACL